MSDLHPDHGGFIDEGMVSAHVRAAQPAAGRVLTMLIDECAADDDDFLEHRVIRAFARFLRRQLGYGLDVLPLADAVRINDAAS